jgi:hypothetical protein
MAVVPNCAKGRSSAAMTEQVVPSGIAVLLTPYFQVPV